MVLYRMLNYFLLRIHSFLRFRILHLRLSCLAYLDIFLKGLLRMVLVCTCHLDDEICFLLWWSLMHLLIGYCRLVLVGRFSCGLLSFSWRLRHGLFLNRNFYSLPLFLDVSCSFLVFLSSLLKVHSPFVLLFFFFLFRKQILFFSVCNIFSID